jgi:hypothetical protein
MSPMEAQITHAPSREEIQVYRNNFLSGVIVLLRKLFML